MLLDDRRGSNGRWRWRDVLDRRWGWCGGLRCHYRRSRLRAGAAGDATDDAIREISASNGDLGPGCSETATNLVRTSSAADREAAEVCARNIGGSALAGLVLPQAATTSATA